MAFLELTCTPNSYHAIPHGEFLKLICERLSFCHKKGHKVTREKYAHD